MASASLGGPYKSASERSAFTSVERSQVCLEASLALTAFCYVKIPGNNTLNDAKVIFAPSFRAFSGLLASLLCIWNEAEHCDERARQRKSHLTIARKHKDTENMCAFARAFFFHFCPMRATMNRKMKSWCMMHSGLVWDESVCIWHPRITQACMMMWKRKVIFNLAFNKEKSDWRRWGSMEC